MATLSATEASERVQQLDGWRIDGQAIVKQYTFAGFPEAVRFVARLVPGAEAADHHPDITINYKRVTLSFSTAQRRRPDRRKTSTARRRPTGCV